MASRPGPQISCAEHPSAGWIEEPAPPNGMVGVSGEQVSSLYGIGG